MTTATTENCESPNTSSVQKNENTTSTSTLPFNKPTINAWPEQKPLEDPKSNWHVFFLVGWLILMLIFLIAGTATPHVKVPGPMDTCTKYGLFQVSLCNGPSYPVADWKKWTSEACKASAQHLQAAGAFAILSILTVVAAIVIAIVQDVLHLVKIFNLLTGIVTGVAWFFMMLTWAIVAGFFTGKMCKGNDMAFSDNDNAEYSAGFFLFVISWLITIGVLAVWFIRQLQVFSPKMSEPLQNPKAHWHTFLMLFWLIVLWMLVAAGSGVPHLRAKELNPSTGQVQGCKKYGLFTIKTCGTAPATSVASWDQSTGLAPNCKAYKQHLQAAGAFAILSVFTITAALAVVIVQDLLQVFTVFKLLSGIIAGASWFFMMIVWAIIAGFYNGKLCKDMDVKFSDQEGAKYTHGFFLFLIGWLFYIPVITLWFLKQLKVLPF